jgi:hypothetical protein
MGLDNGNYFLAPEGSDGTIALVDQLSHVFSTADFGYNYEDKVTYDSDGNPITWGHYGFSSVKITALDISVGTLTYNGEAVTVGTTISIFSLANLVYTAPAGELGKDVASIQFSVTDSNGGIDNTPNTLTIDLATQNSAPFGANKTITILEDQSYALTAADFGFSDPNDTAHPNNLYGVWLGGIYGYGFFNLDGQSFGTDRWVDAADIGKLVYTAQANYNGTSGLQLDFNVYDDGGTENGGQNESAGYNTFTIKVISVNDAPSGADKTMTYLEDSGKHVLSADLFGFSDAADSAAPNSLSKVIIDKISGGGTFMLGNTQVHAGDVITASQLASFTFEPAANGAGAGYASLKFRLIDNGGTTNGGIDTETTAHTLTFDIAPVNDSPVGADKTIEILEDGSHVFTATDFGFSDPDDGSSANDFMTVWTNSYTLGGEFTYDNGDVGHREIAVADLGKLVFKANANDVGQDAFILKFNVKDDGGNDNGANAWSAVANTFTINITSVNDAPTGADRTLTYLEDSGKHVLSADLFDFADANDAAAPDSLSKVIIDKMSGKGTFLLGKTQVENGDVIDVSDLDSLTFQAAANGFGDAYASLKFRLLDDGGTKNGGVNTETTAHTLKFDITAVNDAPSGANKVVTFNEDSGKQALKSEIFGFSDTADAAAPDSLAKVVIDKIAGKGAFMLGNTEVHAGDMIDASTLASLTFQSARNDFGNGYASLKFRLVDDGGADNGGLDTETVAHTLKFNIIDIVDKFIGTAAKNVLTGTVGHDVLDGKGGNDKLTGLGGSDTFVFSRGCGKDVITDFDFKGSDHDTLDLRKLDGVDSFKDLLANHVHKSGADVIITGNHGDQVTLSHTKTGDLAAADFLF